MKKRTNEIIKNVETNLVLEGMLLTSEEKDTLKKCLEDESTFDKEREKNIC